MVDTYRFARRQIRQMCFEQTERGCSAIIKRNVRVYLVSTPVRNRILGVKRSSRNHDLNAVPKSHFRRKNVVVRIAISTPVRNRNLGVKRIGRNLDVERRRVAGGARRVFLRKQGQLCEMKPNAPTRVRIQAKRIYPGNVNQLRTQRLNGTMKHPKKSC